MSNNIFPTLRGLGWDCIKRPTFSTMEKLSQSRKAVRLANDPYPLWQFELNWNYLKDYDITDPQNNPYTDLANIMGFYIGRMGHFDSFLYLDGDDNTVVNQLLGIGDGNAKTFQLVRNMGGALEPIQAVAGTPVVRVAGVVQNSPADFTVSSKGVVTFASAPAAAARVEADFTFFFRVTFAEDMLEFNNFMRLLWDLKTVKLIQDKL